MCHAVGQISDAWRLPEICRLQGSERCRCRKSQSDCDSVPFRAWRRRSETRWRVEELECNNSKVILVRCKQQQETEREQNRILKTLQAVPDGIRSHTASKKRCDLCAERTGLVEADRLPHSKEKDRALRSAVPVERHCADTGLAASLGNFKIRERQMMKCGKQSVKIQ